MNLKLLIIELFKKAIEKIQDDLCEIDKDSAMLLLSLISHEPLSKVEACLELNISRSKFDNLIRNGKLPAGKKRVGFNELVWYKDEILFKFNLLDNYE